MLEDGCNRCTRLFIPTMHDNLAKLAEFLESVPPYDNLQAEERERVAMQLSRRRYQVGEFIYQIGDPLAGVYILKSGEIETTDEHGAVLSRLAPRSTFGERGFLRDGSAATTARATQQSVVLKLPAAEFRRLLAHFPSFQRFFQRPASQVSRSADLSTQRVADLIARPPLSCSPTTTVAEAARLMREHHVSSLGVTSGKDAVLSGILTIRDLSNRVLAEGRDANTPVQEVMSELKAHLSPESLGSDVLHLMLEHKVGHLPVLERGRFVGMITQTDLTRFQATTASALVREITEARELNELVQAAARTPALLVQLVGANQAHEVVTRLITDVTDAITRRLLAMAESELGPPPVPYLWLACGSQGRQEQSGVTDQDNCLFLDDSVSRNDMPYFAQLAKKVSDGLHACGYVYCPGDMMATNPRWCQPVHVWREYFHSWAVTHEPASQMLASVMFDLRPISGATALYRDLQAETLEKASRNSIFLAHMTANSLKRTPPLGLIRGFATMRSGPYRNHIDMKHHGVIPVTDLARIYALQGRITDVNTRARLVAAQDAGVVSHAGGRELIEAYDAIAMLRLQNQAVMVKQGREINNYLAPAELSDFERNALRNAFIVVRTMQSSIGHDQRVLQ